MLPSGLRSQRAILLSIAGAAAVLAGCSTTGSDADPSTTSVAQAVPSPTFVTLPPATILLSTTTVLPVVNAEPTVAVPPGTVTVVTAGAQAAADIGGTTYKVIAGDTVSRIAQRFGITTDVLATFNEWSDGASHPIYPGNSVKIPPGAKDTGTDKTTTTSSTQPSKASIYVVVAGDTLSGIARRAGVTIDSIAKSNSWADGTAHAIFPGYVVRLPADAKPIASPTVTTTSAAPATSTTIASAPTSTTVASGGAYELYTVVANDYLAGIAAKYSTTVAAIVAANGWADGAGHLIVPGQQIKVPVKQA